MTDFVKEQCYSGYFILEYLLGKLGADLEKIMTALGKAHFIPAKDVKKMYADCSEESVRDVSNGKDYYRYCREKSFLAETEENVVFSDADELITIKGEAISALIEENKEFEKNYTSVAMKKALMQAALAGNVCLMKLVGLLMTEGIFFSRNKQAGIRLIAKAAEWNDIGALLMKIYYGEGGSVEEDLNKLSYLSDCHNLCGEITKAGKYEVPEVYKTPKDAALLEKYFSEGKLERSKYSVEFAHLIFSEVIGFNDKCQILSAKQTDAMQISELPLGLKDRQTVCREDVFDDIPIDRETEKKEILQAIRNVDLRTKKIYRPVLLTSKSGFLLELYTEAFKKSFAAMNVSEIEVSELNGADLEPSQNNVFVRFCDENCDNAYFMYFRGRIPQELFAEMKEFLRTDSRAGIRLNVPSVTLDMRLVLPVVVADSANAELLGDVCEVIRIEDANKDEMPALLAELFRRKASEYGVGSVTADEELKNKLLAGKIDDAAAAIDRGVRKTRVAGGNLTLTLKDVADKKVRTERRLGFGGATNED